LTSASTQQTAQKHAFTTSGNKPAKVAYKRTCGIMSLLSFVPDPLYFIIETRSSSGSLTPTLVTSLCMSRIPGAPFLGANSYFVQGNPRLILLVNGFVDERWSETPHAFVILMEGAPMSASCARLRARRWRTSKRRAAWHS
jgi:hypothetical protein